MTKSQKELMFKQRIERLEYELNEQNKIVNSLANKLGYHLEENGETEAGSKVYEFVKDDNGVPEGDYTNPIHIDEDGLVVHKNLWYYTTDKDLPHEAKQDAFVTPEDFYDTMWFDFVE